MDQLPPIPIALLEELEKRFPERCPHPEMSERDIWRMVGAREVIRLLRYAYDEQNAPTQVF